VIVLVGLLPASAAATPTWNNYSWTQQVSRGQSVDHVVATVGDSDPSQSWKSIFFQADGTPPNSIQASNITLTVGSTTDTTDCTEQSGTNALEIVCNNLATGFLSVGKTMNLSFVPNPVIHVNVGGYFGATDFANQTYAAVVSGPTDVTIGNAYIDHVSLTGLKIDRPDLDLKLHKGSNGPKIKGFKFSYPRPLSIYAQALQPVIERWSDHKWSCHHRKRELDCHTTTPVNATDVHVAYPLLREHKVPKGTYKVELKVGGTVVGTVLVPIE
jgi:hypothetical protein